MRARGHAIVLVMAIVTATAVVGMIAATRLSIDVLGRRPHAARSQALWLARSAIEANLSGKKTVSTGAGQATVQVERRAGAVIAVVELAGGRAEIHARRGATGFEEWDE